MSVLNKINYLIEQQPAVVAQLFKAHRINAPVNTRNVGNAITVLRRPFVNDLLSILNIDLENDYSNATGDVNFQNVVDGLARISLGASNIANDIKGKPRLVSRNNGYIIDGRPRPGDYDDVYEPTGRIFGINRTLFFVLAGILVVAIALQYQKK